MAGLCAVASAYGLLLYLESFAASAACCRATWPNPNPVQAERLLDARDPAGLDPVLQERAARQELAARPVDPSGWLRLAYADSLRNGRLTPAGLAALKTSYTMVAYGGQNAGWRVFFGLNHLYELDADTRRQVLAELKVLSQDYPRNVPARARMAHLTNPLGRYYAAQYEMLPPPAAQPVP